jgi:hypothetical protein
MARPTKLTKARREKILAAVRAGATRELAARAGGVSRSTLQVWIARGGDFADEVAAAEARWELGALGRITRAGVEGDWRALTWLLARTRPEVYGNNAQLRVEVEPLDGAAALGDLSKLSERELAQLQQLLEITHG